MWVGVAIGLITGFSLGAFFGWMICSLLTVAHDSEQRSLICRQKMCISAFLKLTEPYHDDHHLASVRKFAKMLFGEVFDDQNGSA